MSTLSVVVPIYDKIPELRMMLDGFARQTDPEFDLHLVNDGGLPQMGDVVTGYADRISNLYYHYLTPATQDFRAAATRQLGLYRSCNDRILNIDGDCIPADNLVAGHKSCDDPSAFILGHRYHCFGDPLRETAPSCEADIRQHICREDSRWKKGPGFETRRQHGTYRFKIGKHYGLAWSCHISYSAEFACRVGGWDTQFVGYGEEDIDFAGRMCMAGQANFEVWFDLTVYHVDHPERPDRIDKSSAGKARRALSQRKVLPNLERKFSMTGCLNPKAERVINK